MLELMIETWSNPQSGTVYRWSLWIDGKRVAMGGPHATVNEAEVEAIKLCAARIGRPPDRITRI